MCRGSCVSGDLLNRTILIEGNLAISLKVTKHILKTGQFPSWKVILTDRFPDVENGPRVGVFTDTDGKSRTLESP